MQHSILLIVTLLSVSAGAFGAKLYENWTSDCASVPCVYVQVRLSVFEQMIAARGKTPTYLVIGDSLTESAPWPAMCGLQPVAAGISGAQVATWLPHARSVADKLGPKVVVIALGTNDVLVEGRLGSYEALSRSLVGYELVAIPLHGMMALSKSQVQAANARIANAVRRVALKIDAKTTDGIHMTHGDYQRWLAQIEKAVCRRL